MFWIKLIVDKKILVHVQMLCSPDSAVCISDRIKETMLAVTVIRDHTFTTL